MKDSLCIWLDLHTGLVCEWLVKLLAWLSHRCELCPNPTFYFTILSSFATGYSFEVLDPYYE
ncbi:hypothetical protein GIB67_025924 [Kingdonia uniflora]|uniref:Uncharacterized protein n=1 Tax=Kingdonia uniflora TaxID=39325 RepID=A0A7J7NZ04_9MAGN|nr:hypothetical protein GIB67_025924 [Kingdonia uniflora]